MLLADQPNVYEEVRSGVTTESNLAAGAPAALGAYNPGQGCLSDQGVSLLSFVLLFYRLEMKHFYVLCYSTLVGRQ